MSDTEFGRPGTPARPPPEHWPYHVPSPPLVEPDVFLEVIPEPSAEPDGQSSRRSRLLVAAAVGVLVGVVLGGVWVSGVVREPVEPPPVPILVTTFPVSLLGAQRNDIALREAGFRPTIERLDAEFEAQLSAFRFSYGGDGATLGYGRILALTIVDGTLPPNLPRNGTLDQNGKTAQTRRLISLRTDQMSCTFEPQPVFNSETGLDLLGDFGSNGRTDCVLVDSERNLSLRISQNLVVRGGDAFATSASFRDELESIHEALVG